MDVIRASRKTSFYPMGTLQQGIPERLRYAFPEFSF